MDNSHPGTMSSWHNVFACSNSFKTYYPHMKIDPVCIETYLPGYIGQESAGCLVLMSIRHSTCRFIVVTLGIIKSTFAENNPNLRLKHRN